jgi:hypothetical protein
VGSECDWIVWPGETGRLRRPGWVGFRISSACIESTIDSTMSGGSREGGGYQGGFLGRRGITQGFAGHLVEKEELWEA